MRKHIVMLTPLILPGIAAFHVAKTENATVLPNGNQIADLGSYTKSDGTEGAVGQITGGMADIDLADNPFYRSFADTIPLTEQAQTLPDMQGSGAVRDLREAESDGQSVGWAEPAKPNNRRECCASCVSTTYRLRGGIWREASNDAVFEMRRMG